MGYFVRSKSGGKTASLLTGIGLGAALMYVLDPERGRRRRALARDKAVAFANKTGRAVAKTSRDLGNRAKGVAAEVRSATSSRRDAADEDMGAENPQAEPARQQDRHKDRHEEL